MDPKNPQNAKTKITAALDALGAKYGIGRKLGAAAHEFIWSTNSHVPENQRLRNFWARDGSWMANSFTTLGKRDASRTACKDEPALHHIAHLKRPNPYSQNGTMQFFVRNFLSARKVAS